MIFVCGLALFLLQDSWKEDKKCFDLGGYYSCCLCSGAWNLIRLVVTELWFLL